MLERGNFNKNMSRLCASRERANFPEMPTSGLDSRVINENPFTSFFNHHTVILIIRNLFARNELDRYGLSLDEEVGAGTYSKVFRGSWRKSKSNNIKV